MGYSLLFIGGCDTKQMLLLAVVFAALFALLAIIEPYRMARLTSFVDPGRTRWATVISDSVLLCAWFRRALWRRPQQQPPEAALLTYGESDFIFAIVCEELGLVGGLLVLAAYGFIVYRAFELRCSAETVWQHAGRRHHGRFRLAGIRKHWCLHRLLPTTGQALPFITRAVPP
jgi:cell division protein FtsW